MSEWVAFWAGIIAMGIVWFVHDEKYNPYQKGYVRGFYDGIQKAMRHFPKPEGADNDVD